MNYTLMHKNLPVLDLELDEVTGSVLRIGQVYAPAHIPLGVKHTKSGPDRAGLNAWWIDRSIPASRSGVRKALETMNIPSPQALLTRCFGLSLSDQYWVKPAGSDLAWSRINFFENAFSEDMGDILLGKTPDHADFDFRSPDNTSDGYLKKRWKIIDGKRCLLKAGSQPFMQQPFNEVIASSIAARLGIAHVPYRLVWDEGIPYSVCEDFVTPDTELISAWRVMQTQKKDNSTSVYQHYINCCETLGVPGIPDALDRMIVLDYIIANEDRHQNNFGLIRNADTLEWLGPAPIFDSGSSLGYDKLPGQIASGRFTECKPFKKSHEEQLLLVRSLDWLDFTQLEGLGEEMRSLFAGAGEFVDEARQEAIISSTEKRIEAVRALSLEQRFVQDDAARDVTRDKAQDYSMDLNQ